MRVVKQSAGRLVLQEKPWLVWLVGGLFLVAGSFVALNSDERVFGGAFAIAGAVLILAFANTETATFDRGTGRFTRETRGLLRNSTTACALADVTAVRVDASAAGSPSRAYRLALVMASGARVPLTTSYASGKPDKDQQAAEIRRFLRLPDEAPAPGFGEMVRAMTGREP